MMVREEEYHTVMLIVIYYFAKLPFCLAARYHVYAHRMQAKLEIIKILNLA